MSAPDITTKPYAVAVMGDSMVPRYFDGGIVYVDPSVPIGAGRHSYVVVQLLPESKGSETPNAVIKKYERQTDTHLVLSQLNPPLEHFIPLDNVKSVHVAVAADPDGAS